MAAKKDNIFVRAKAYQKDHPRTAWAECIQKVKGKKVSGSVTGAKAKRKRVTGIRVASTVGKAVVKRSPVTKTDLIKKAAAIVKDIEKLEVERKLLKSREMRDIYSLQINRQHDKLDALKRAHK